MIAKASGWPAWPYSPPRKPPWLLGKASAVKPQALGDTLSRPMRHLALGIGTYGDHYRGGCGPQRVEVVLVMRAGVTMFWPSSTSVSGPIVLGWHAEHRGVRSGAARRKPLGNVPAMAHDRDEMRHPRAESWLWRG